MSKNKKTTEKQESVLLSCELTLMDFKKTFSASGDIIFRDILIRNKDALGIHLIYVDGMANLKIIDDNIIRPLTVSKWFDDCTNLKQAYQLCKDGALEVSAIKATEDFEEAATAILIGKTLLLFDKFKSALILDTIGFEKRSITTATEEETYRSGKDSFVETLRINTSLLRKKIKNPYLVIEETVVGKQSQTRVCIAYMQNICNNSMVEKIKKRIDNIHQDKALSIQDIYSNVVEEKLTLFPTAIVTEKPDVCCMSLLDGKVAVLIDEVPYSLIFPGVFGDLFQSTSDYGYNFIIATFSRIVRYISFFIALILPGFFVAIATFHPEMIPYKLALSIAASRAGTPFHIYMEMLIMTLAFFILIQASMQISRTIGGTISIVGGLVLGEAAISAGFVSPSVIVVVATAAICSMAVPNKEGNTALWLFQILCTLLSSFFGLYGLNVALLILLFILAKLEPLGVPYLSPYVNKSKLQLDDSLVKFPVGSIKNRPLYLHPKNKRRVR